MLLSPKRLTDRPPIESGAETAGTTWLPPSTESSPVVSAAFAAVAPRSVRPSPLPGGLVRLSFEPLAPHPALEALSVEEAQAVLTVFHAAALSEGPQIRILYTSGYAPDTLTKGGRLLDGAALLPKPYTKSELATKVRLVLDGAVTIAA